jgi:Pentapeptide repeats (8 copies)
MRCFRNAAVVAVIAGLVSVGAASAAGADTVIGTCTIVAIPTQLTHTVCPGAQLQDADLSSADLTFADLSGAFLSGANLHQARVSGANLFGTHLDGANLSDALVSKDVLNNADLTGADLTNTILNLTHFGGANLSGANLSGAVGTDPANFSDVTWSNTTCPDGSNSDNHVAGCFSALSDTTPPTASPVASPSGWTNGSVNVTWNWTDTGGSGIDPANCTDSSTYDGPSGVVPVSATCADLAGNIGQASVTVMVETGPPSLFPSVSPNPVMLNGVATAQANAVDFKSGVASQQCDTPDTSTPGLHTVSCTATDNAGNVSTQSVSYVVDVGVTTLSPSAKTQLKSGASIPVKFQLMDANGPISATLAAQLSTTCAATVSLGVQPPVCAAYNPITHFFQADLKAPKGLTVGSSIPITITVTVGTTTVATATTSIIVTK